MRHGFGSEISAITALNVHPRKPDGSERVDVSPVYGTAVHHIGVRVNSCMFEIG